METGNDVGLREDRSHILIYTDARFITTCIHSENGDWQKCTYLNWQIKTRRRSIHGIRTQSGKDRKGAPIIITLKRCFQASALQTKRVKWLHRQRYSKYTCASRETGLHLRVRARTLEEGKAWSGKKRGGGGKPQRWTECVVLMITLGQVGINRL